jgi:hypothetical protein
LIEKQTENQQNCFTATFSTLFVTNFQQCFSKQQSPCRMNPLLSTSARQRGGKHAHDGHHNLGSAALDAVLILIKNILKFAFAEAFRKNTPHPLD